VQRFALTSAEKQRQTFFIEASAQAKINALPDSVQRTFHRLPGSGCRISIGGREKLFAPADGQPRPHTIDPIANACAFSRSWRAIKHSAHLCDATVIVMPDRVVGLADLLGNVAE